MSLIALRLAGKIARKLIENNMGKDDEEESMFGDSTKELIANKIAGLLPSARREREDMDRGNVENTDGLGELGALFVKRFGKNKGQPRFGASGKGRHGDVEIQDSKGAMLNGETLRRNANLWSGERLDTGRAFQVANGKGTNAGAVMVRKGSEIKMGFGIAVLSVATLTVGAFPQSQPNETFEIQNLYLAHNGDGASAAATIAVHFTLLAHLALASFKVGDDPLITGSNYVPVHGYNGPEELAGYVTSFTDPVAISAYNGAAYAAPLFLGLGGEAVAKI